MFSGFFYVIFILYLFISLPLYFYCFFVVACNSAFEQGHLEPMLLLLLVNNESRKEKRKLLYL